MTHSCKYEGISSCYLICRCGGEGFSLLIAAGHISNDKGMLTVCLSPDLVMEQKEKTSWVNLIGYNNYEYEIWALEYIKGQDINLPDGPLFNPAQATRWKAVADMNVSANAASTVLNMSASINSTADLDVFASFDSAADASDTASCNDVNASAGSLNMYMTCLVKAQG